MADSRRTNCNTFICHLLTITMVCCLFTFNHHLLTSAATPEGCNESICGSVVSKCLLTQSCKCGPDPVRNNITCAKDCFFCLDYLYSECCSCVDVCRKENMSTFSLSLKSNVEDLPEPMPELFQMLVESADSQGRWTTLRFPAHHTIIGLNKDLHFVRITPHPVTQNGSIDTTPPPMNINPTYDSSIDNDVNCTVAFMKPCMSLNKCRENCMTMGSTSYRWFHDGCCECVGNTCLNYGLNEGRCEQCPLSKDLLSSSSDGLDDEEELVIQDPEGRATDPIQAPVDLSNTQKDPVNSVESSTKSSLSSIDSTTTESEALGTLHTADDNSLGQETNL